MSLSRIMLQLPPRDLTLGDHAVYLLEATRRLEQADARLAEFRIDLGRQRGGPLTSVEGLTEQLEQRQEAFAEGEKRGARGRLMIAVPEGRRIRLHASLTFGHDIVSNGTQGFPTVLKLRWMGRAAPSADSWRRMLVSLVDLYRPLWATLGGALTPTPTIDERGVPLVGWDTFLCRELGRLPELPEEAVVTPWGDLGAIVRAFPEVLRESDPKHLAALTAVRRALVDARLLKGHAELDRLPMPAPPAKPEPVPARDDAPPAEDSWPATGAVTDETIVASVFHSPAAALPFRQGRSSPQPSPPAPAERVPVRGGTLDVPIVGRREPTSDGTIILPPDGGAAVEHLMMSPAAITRYARMHAELTREARLLVLVRYGIRDEHEFARIDSWWRAELEQQPMKQAQFRALYEKYVREQGEGS